MLKSICSKMNNMEDLRIKLIKETEEKLKQAFSEDNLIIHLSRLISELDSMITTLNNRFLMLGDKVGEVNQELLKKMQDARLKNFKQLEKLMLKNCPRLTKTAGVELGANLVSQAGSIKKLAMMASSKVQLLGAEKSLFRHLKTGAKAPKFGIICLHEDVKNAENKGKAARVLASEISKAVKQDYFGK
ncbi:hypothetical protein D6777_03835 [Candidatus Woesearchaeota archaeon]|nr:MAG: hypothetical protein D6777_03835 [Candidatus Woesearchaeota archaeon]